MFRLMLVALLGLLCGLLLMRAVQTPPVADPGVPVITDDDRRVQVVHATLRRDGLGAALDSLVALVEREPAVEPAAHQILHGLARVAMHESGYDLTLVQQCRPIFHSGCFHGTLEAYFGDASRLDREVIARICAGNGAPDHPHALECAHGMGHGLIGALDHDLFAALSYCDGLPGGQAQWCYSGVFMENVNSAVLEESGARGHDHHAGVATGHAEHAGGPPATGAATNTRLHEHLRATDPHYPCNAVEPRQRHTCYFYQPFVQLRATDFNYAATLATCDGAEQEWVGSCYHGFGTQIAGLLTSAPLRILEACTLGRAELAPRCVAGAAEYLVDLEWDARRGLEFCALASADVRAACFERVGSRVALIHHDAGERERVCDFAASASAAAWCRAGAGLSERR